MWITAKALIVGATAFFWLQSSSLNPGGAANKAPTEAPSKPAAEMTIKIDPAQAVITIHGVCEESKEKASADPAACYTVITRERFEHLVEALHPGQELPANARNNLAKIYAEYLTVEAATRKAGMEDTAEYHEFMNWMRVLAATEYYRRKLQEKYNNPSQEEIDAYYKEHLTDYEKAKLVRVLIPRENPRSANKDEFEKKALEAAEAARANLAKGMDATEVQKNAYSALDLQGPPPVDLGTLRRKDLMTEEAREVFSLKPGEVAKVQTEPKNYVVYKVVGRETVPEEELKKFISSQITERKFREAMSAVVDSASVDLNEQYFGAPGPAPTEPPRSPHTMTSH